MGLSDSALLSLSRARRAQQRVRGLVFLLALALVVSGCATASAQHTASKTENGQVPEVLAAPDEPNESTSDTSPIESAGKAGASMDSVVHSVLVSLGETGYYGACPTVEALGLDPLSTETPELLAEETQTQHCSWTVAEHDEGVTLNLDRLDVFGDEALYYVAVVADGAGWRLAEAAERSGIGSDLISPSAVYIDDLLPT